MIVINRVREVEKAIVDGRYKDAAERLREAFIWSDTSPSFDFWFAAYEKLKCMGNK